MSILSLSDVGREIGAVTILENVSVSVAAGERIGLVGPNGAGKTTLLRMMIGRDEPDRGRVDRARGVNIEVLAQESSHDPRLLGAATLADAVRSGAEEITRIANALQEAEAAGSVGTPEYAAARSVAVAPRLPSSSDSLHRGPRRNVEDCFRSPAEPAARRPRGSGWQRGQ